jgi:hypothetical protein
VFKRLDEIRYSRGITRRKLDESEVRRWYLDRSAIGLLDRRGLEKPVFWAINPPVSKRILGDWRSFCSIKGVFYANNV